MLRWGILAIVVVLISGAAAVGLPMLIDESDAVKEPVFVNSGAAPTGPQGQVQVVGEDNKHYWMVHDFGVMSQHETGERDWEVKNTGEGDLEVWFASSTCSCTIAGFGKDSSGESKRATIKPNESTKIKLNWETRTNEGPFEKSATIGTNDRKRPRLEFRTKGIILPVIASNPYPPVLSDLEAEVDRSEMITMPMYSASHADMKIVKVRSSKPDLILATSRPMNDEERASRKLKSGGLVVSFEIKPGMPVGPFSEEVVLYTDHPKAPEFSVKLIGKVQGPVQFFPSRVYKSAIDSAQGSQAQVKIVVQGANPVEFQVKNQPKGLKISITPAPSNAETAKRDKPILNYTLTAELPAGSPINTYAGTIEVSVNHPQVKTLMIPVTMVVTK